MPRDNLAALSVIEMQIIGLLSLLQLLGQLPKLSLLQEHDGKLNNYKEESTWFSL